MNVRQLLENERKRLNVSWTVLEQDYILDWMLWGIASVSELKGSLVFKGGTALKKVYFDDYRFSEDLDFTAKSNAPVGQSLETAIKVACQNAQSSMNELMENPRLECTRYTEQKPHPEEQEAFIIRAQLPWHRSLHTRIMVEITKAEILVTAPVLHEVRNTYDKSMVYHIHSYSVEEIVAEKLRAILQNTKTLHERGWSRSRARDYYDIWRILSKYENEIAATDISLLLQKKCVGKGVSFTSVENFFDDKALASVKKDWLVWLKPFVSELPDYEIVISELRNKLELILGKYLPKSQIL